MICSLESLLYFFCKIHVIVYRQNYYRDINFGTIYLKYCSKIVFVGGRRSVGGLAVGLAATSRVFDISEFA